MSDEEYSEYEDEEVEEEEVEEVEEAEAEVEEEAEEQEEERFKRASVDTTATGGPATPAAASHAPVTFDGENLNEAEKAMLAAKKRHENDEQAKLDDYEKIRRAEREKEEEELKKLKEKQEQRRLAREQEEREAAERKKLDEERRKREEEDRRARAEEEKRKKEEEKLKKAQMMGGGFPGQQQGGRNFVINKKEESAGVGDRFGNIVQAKQEMGMTKEQQEEAKTVFMQGIRKNIAEASTILPNDMKAKIKELHQRICKLEAQKYDSEKRHERQEYDLKELNERSRQVARANNAKNGQINSDDTGGRHPPKVQIASKYDRQIDRRNFKERRQVYENKVAFPCFPGVPPPPAIYEKIIKKMDYEIQQELDAAEEEEEDY
ncbi:hypothetical protein GCK72_019209 [Caenorhabditis remanei]|uniref:Uncharacterized protein n=1 Tax=Caenorhabditis remanei TaxID=31234 RepID=A0A6A5GD53_CAERE|nr:hypothetical protein GCK72_019209 [Caenorhabditis remanei]KAF1752654.1 hypothetical protein GCK72_019209 [Caenorhabditis remanei]